MTAKDYQRIAAVLHDALSVEHAAGGKGGQRAIRAIRLVARLLAWTFSDEDPRFSDRRFYAAAGCADLAEGGEA